MRTGADRLRPAWGSLPAGLRASVIDAIGGVFVSDSPAHGGFSAGYAGAVRTSTGGAFVKAIAADGHVDSREFLRRESHVLQAVPPALSPSLRARIDDHEGCAVILDVIEGDHPGAPWSIGQLHAIAATLSRLAATQAPAALRSAAEAMVPGFTRWRQIEADEHLRAALPAALKPRLGALVDLEQEFPRAIAGDAVMHNDLRADNILISGGEARFIDWPHALRAAPWADLPGLLPSIEAAGGPRCEEAWLVFEEHGAPPPESLLPVTAGFASFFWHSQSLPDIPELPGLRAFQRAQATPALRWLATMI